MLQVQATSITFGVVNCTNEILCPGLQNYPYDCCWRHASDQNTKFVFQNAGSVPQSSSTLDLSPLCAKPLQWIYLCLNAFWRHYGLCAGVRSSLKKTIYDIAAAIRIPSLKDWPRSLSDGLYIPLEPENEILIEQNPASSTVGVCNSVSLSIAHLPILCFPFSNIFSLGSCKWILHILHGAHPSSHQLLPAYQRIIDQLVDACPCIKKGCVTNCLNASCFLTDWSVFTLTAQSTELCIGSCSAAGIQHLIFLLSTPARTLAL